MCSLKPWNLGKGCSFSNSGLKEVKLLEASSISEIYSVQYCPTCSIMKYLLGIDCVQVADNESNPEESTGGLCPPQFAAMVPLTPNGVSK